MIDYGTSVPTLEVSDAKVCRPYLGFVLTLSNSCLFHDHPLRPYDVCSHRSSDHLSKRLLLGCHCVGSIADILLHSPRTQHTQPRHHGILRWVVCINIGSPPNEPLSSKTSLSHVRRYLPYGSMPLSTWSWGEWSTISRPVRSSSESKLGVSPSTS